MKPTHTPYITYHWINNVCLLQSFSSLFCPYNFGFCGSAEQ